MKQGMIIVFEGALYRVMTTNHVAPGNWRAMVQTKLLNIKTGSQIERRCGADEKFERAEMEQHEMEYLYSDGDFHHFMNSETFEQMTLSTETLGETLKYLQSNTKVTIDFYDNKPVSIELPKTIIYKVVEADPSVKRATASAQFKNATLENGLTVRVPSFVEAGDKVKIDTDSGEYVERV
jgi:elongation factor P